MIVIYNNLIMLWLYDKNMMMMIINKKILFEDNLDRWGDKLSSEFEYYLRMF